MDPQCGRTVRHAVSAGERKDNRSAPGFVRGSETSISMSRDCAPADLIAVVRDCRRQGFRAQRTTHHAYIDVIDGYSAPFDTTRLSASSVPCHRRVFAAVNPLSGTNLDIRDEISVIGC